MKRSPLVRKTPLAKTRAPRKKARRAKTASQLRKEATVLWGRYIHARDKHCQFCGRTDGKFDAHHIVRREFNATRTDEMNGVLLCGWTCHRKVMHEDPFAAVQFYTRHLGLENYKLLREKAYNGAQGRYGVDYWRAEVERLKKLLEAAES